MSKKLLITGINGFVGRHLVNYVLSNNLYTITGVQHEHPNGYIEQNKNVDVVTGDLLDPSFCHKLIRQVKPDYIIHLAAQSSGRVSWEKPTETIQTNVLAQLHVLDAIREAKIEPVTLIISSSDIYGDVTKEDLPIDEETPIRPNNPYATSKALQDELAYSYFLTYNLPIIRMRPFGHLGPGGSPNTAIASFIEKIKNANQHDTLLVGNIEIKRDFTDVRDIVRAYILALEQANPGEAYNVGSGHAYRLKDLLQQLIALSGKSLEVKLDQSLIRPKDILETVCDYSKFHKATQWQPEIPIEQTLKDMFTANHA